MISQSFPLVLAFSLIASEAISFEKVVFSSGEEGYHTYRIPALWETESGVLLAFAEGRKNSWRDQGDIDVVLRRSLDGGLSWEAMRVVWSDGENTCGNPTVVQDRDTGRVLLFMTHNLADDTLRKISGGTSEGVRTIWSCFSDDDGMTWSEPVNRFDEVQPADVRWDATGPGRGIQLERGDRRGRLIIPAIGRNLFSDDHGATWRQGGLLPPGSSESQVAELSDGRLLRNDRTTGSKKALHARAFCLSGDQGASWGPMVWREDLVDPICQGSLIATTRRGGESVLLFSNPASTQRENMTVHYSLDDGKTWRLKKTIHPGASAYSCLSPLGPDGIGLLYENGEAWDRPTQLYQRITFCRFDLE